METVCWVRSPPRPRGESLILQPPRTGRSFMFRTVFRTVVVVRLMRGVGGKKRSGKGSSPFFSRRCPMARTHRRKRPLALERLEDRCLLSYTLTDLGTLGGNISYPFGINNADPVQVVGESNIGTFGSPTHAFLWEAGQG